MKNKMKLILSMMLNMMTFPLSSLSADSNLDNKKRIIDYFPNEDTAIAVSMDYNRKIDNPRNPVNINEMLSLSDLDMIDYFYIKPSTSNTEFDKDLAQLKNLANLSIYGVLSLLDGIELLSDSLTNLTLNRTVVTDFTPIGSLNKLKVLAIPYFLAETINAISSNNDI